jgi:hypothetical protein
MKHTDTIQELREWAAMVIMGWKPDTLNRYYINFKDSPYGNLQIKSDILGWQPDNPSTGQIWMFVEGMRKLGWRLRVDDYGIYFCATWMMPDKENKTWAIQLAEHRDTNLCIAILKAAKATEVKP